MTAERITWDFPEPTVGACIQVLKDLRYTQRDRSQAGLLAEEHSQLTFDLPALQKLPWLPTKDYISTGCLHVSFRSATAMHRHPSACRRVEPKRVRGERPSGWIQVMAGMNFRGAKGDTVLASLRRNLHSAVLTLATDLDLASGPVEVRGERPSGWIQVMAGMNFRGAKGDTPDTTFVAIVEG